MGERWRLVTVSNGVRYVSSVVMTEDEAREHVELEGVMHEQTDWEVEWGPTRFTALAPNRQVLRTVKAERFDAFNDFLT